MPLPQIQAVCFDMDGLLFNTEDIFDLVGTEMLARRGKELDHNLVRKMMGQQADVALRLFIDHYQLTESIAELIQETDEIFDRLLPEQLSPLPGAIPLLERLTEYASRPVALTTSSSVAAVNRIMGICDLRNFFSFQLTAEEVQHGKPQPEIYLTAAERFGISPGEMLVFEDSENGCRAGVAAGAHVVAIPSKHGHLHNYEGSLFVADSLEDERIHNLLFA